MIKNISNTKWLSKIPKIELHLHLEGAIPLSSMWQLIQKYGGDQGVDSIEALHRRFEYSDFISFLRTWSWKNSFIREYEDFELIAMSVAEDLKQQNIIYAEAFISPPEFVRHGLEINKIIKSVRRGLDRVSGIKINLVVDLVRDYGEVRAMETLHAVLESREYGVVGIGIGGSEKEFPPGLFKEVYHKARVAGLKTSAHAGEAAGPESIWGAINDLQVDRIGHGTRALEDLKLAEFLIKQNIPIEMCPISNLRTKVIGSVKEHPIRWFFDRGALVTINTDDPKMFNNTLVDEFELLMTEHGFTRAEIKKLTLNAAKASWLPEEEKTKLNHLISSNPAWQ